jgi:signal transduction histidine kinase
MKRFKDFPIRTKFALLFIIGAILIVAVTFVIFYHLVIVGLERIEDYYLENEFRGVQTVMAKTQDTLLKNVRDYAYWDDMYNYANTRDEKWVKINITDWIPKNFGINLVLAFNAKGELIYQYGDFEEFPMEKDLSSQPLIKAAFESGQTYGLYPTTRGILYVASSQIMHTDESGPRNGTYLYGKLINKDALTELKAMTGMDLSIISESEVIGSTVIGHIDRPKNFADIYNELTSKKFRQFNIYKPNYQVSFIYSLLKDIQDKNIAMLELIWPRKSVALFRETIIKTFIWIFGLIILVVFVSTSVITNFVLKPLNILNKTIDEIRKTKDALRRVKIESADEIGSLAGNFNTMMESLSKFQNELIKAQHNLIKSEKMATAAELAMGTVHQINNPLSIAIGRSQLLRRRISYKTPIPETDLENDLKIIEEQTKRAVDIVNSLLHYAVPTTLRFERCNINELLKDIISLLKDLLETGKIDVVENLKTDLPVVEYCDIQQVRDVFINIIMNAQQAMEGGGRLEISTDYDAEDNMVWIKFKDNGCGIVPEDIDKLFTPLFSTKADRTGLGLAISYNIAKGHGGTIDVESQVGVGSTFTVKLPVGRA